MSLTELSTDAYADRTLISLMLAGDADPYPFYDWLRTNAPVYWSPTVNAYVVSRFADAERVLVDAKAFPCVDAAVLERLFPQTQEHEAYRIIGTSLLGHNGESHARLRRLVSRDFTARRIHALAPDVDRICAQLLDEAERRLRDGQVVDLHDLVSVPLPLRVLAELLGVPSADLPHVSALVPRMLHVVDPMATEEMMNDADAAFHEFGAYLSDLVTQRRRNPAGDLISALAAVNQADGDRLSDDELQTMVFALWAAGFETPAIAIDNGVLTMLRFPEHAATLRDPAGAGAFVDELLRWDAPAAVAAARRYTAADVELGGVHLEGGREVRILLGAANRDPAAFDDPDRFDPTRRAATLSFGGGFHYCVGSALARMEISTLMHQLAVRMPGLRLAAEPVRRRSLPLRDFTSFPVTLAAAG